MQNSKSEFKCTVEKGAIPVSRLIGKSKLNKLKATFNSGMTTKATKRDSNKLSAMASNKQKESYARGEVARTEALTRRDAKAKEKKVAYHL